MLKLIVLLSIVPMFVWARPRPPVVNPASRPPNVRVAVDSISGTGCPAGTARAALSPDSSVVSVLFDQLNTEIHPGEAPQMRKQCTVRLKVYFSGKYRVAIVGSDVRAFAAIPAGGRSTINIQHNSPFTINPKVLQRMNVNRTLTGPAMEDMLLQARFADVPMWSHCGSQGGLTGFNLMSINMTIDSVNQSSESLIASIDSADLDANAGLQYHLMWRYDGRNCP